MATKRKSEKAAVRSGGIHARKPGLRVVSLFAGAGGLDLAFCTTDQVSELFSTDSQPAFLDTVIRNMPTHFPHVRHRHLLADARQLSGERIRNETGKQLDIVIGGPPCDDFTSFGLKRGMDGEKGPIVFEFARLVGELRPRAFLFENVPNLQSMCSRGFQELLDRLRSHGYTLTHDTLAACDYGAPTVRERLFVVGVREPLTIEGFRFPLATHGVLQAPDLFSTASSLLPHVTVRTVLADLPDVNTAAASLLLNHSPRVHRPATIAHMRTIPPGIAVSKSYRYRAPLDGLTRSLTAGLDNSTKSYLHPIYHREMTVREYARIHGFPDSWNFAGTRDNGIKQVANAVPVQLGRPVAAAVVSHLHGEGFGAK
jgi:DNA (cytosine-5)-methyltransferase 1